MADDEDRRRQGRKGARDWDPSYPDIAVSPEEGLYDHPVNDDPNSVPYEPAPATSHVYGWKGLAGGFVKRFYGPAVRAPGGTAAVLMVAFKPSPEHKGGYPPVAITSEYEYYIQSADELNSWLEKFRTAEHPGHVVQELIKARVPYKRKS